MRFRPLQALVMGCLLLLVLVPQVACTAIGALIGSSFDSMRDPRVIPAGEAVAIRRGTTLSLQQRDGQWVTGTYLDTITLSQTQHAEAWRRWQAGGPLARSVALGDEVTVVDDTSEWRGRFMGYHYRSISVTPIEGSASRRLPMLALRALRGPGGYEIAGPELAALDAAGALPSAWGLRLRNAPNGHGITAQPEQDVTVAWSEIASARLAPSHTGRNIGTLVGLTADVMLIAAAGYGTHQSYGTDGCSNSGGFWILNAEPDRGFHLTAAPYDRLAGQEMPRGANSPARTPFAAFTR